VSTELEFGHWTAELPTGASGAVQANQKPQNHRPQGARQPPRRCGQPKAGGRGRQGLSSDKLLLRENVVW